MENDFYLPAALEWARDTIGDEYCHMNPGSRNAAFALLKLFEFYDDVQRSGDADILWIVKEHFNSKKG